jgi:hypothetical protein
VLDAVQYGFERTADAALPADGFAMVREAEGITLVRPGPGWARITLGVHSSLDAVGLTAKVSAALTECGIGANIVAALHHDHVFVPWERRAEAMAALRKLSRGLAGNYLSTE